MTELLEDQQGTIHFLKLDNVTFQDHLRTSQAEIKSLAAHDLKWANYFVTQLATLEKGLKDAPPCS